MVVELVEKYYIQYAPFYCSMILYATNKSGEERFSNSAVESEFKFLKNIFLDHDRFPLNIFIRHIYEYHVSRTLDVIAAAARRSNKSKQKKKESFELQEEDHTEIWRKRKQKNRTPKYMGLKVRHIPENLKLPSVNTIASDATTFVDSNIKNIESPHDDDIEKTSEKTIPSQPKKVSSKKKVTALPSDMKEIYEDVISKAAVSSKVNTESGHYVSTNEGELQTALEDHRKQMKLRAESNKTQKRTELMEGGLIIYERAKNEDGKYLTVNLSIIFNT